MEKEEAKKGFKFTTLDLDLPSIEEKLDKIEQPSAKKILDDESKSNSTAANVAEKMLAMKKHKLTLDLVPITGYIEYEDSLLLGDILKYYKKDNRYKEESKREIWSQKRLASQYILQGIERDRKKLENNRNNT